MRGSMNGFKKQKRAKITRIEITIFGGSRKFLKMERRRHQIIGVLFGEVS